MKKEYKFAAALFVVVAIGSFLARRFGWYADYWFTDVILHTISGVMFGLLWAGFASRTLFSSKIVFAIGMISVGVLGSFLWEVWELWGSIIFPAFTTNYVPNLADSLKDIACGMLGATGLSFFLKNPIK